MVSDAASSALPAVAHPIPSTAEKSFSSQLSCQTLTQLSQPCRNDTVSRKLLDSPRWNYSGSSVPAVITISGLAISLAVVVTGEVPNPVGRLDSLFFLGGGGHFKSGHVRVWGFQTQVWVTQRERATEMSSQIERLNGHFTMGGGLATTTRPKIQQPLLRWVRVPCSARQLS